jgi:hypothetical protein
MSNNLPATQPDRRPVPKIDELYQDVELASKFNELNLLLNRPPKPEWVKVNKFANNSNYIPIGIIEYLLTSIYIKWRVEIKSSQVIANSVVVTIRLYVLDPISGEWDWQDGIGASPIQTKAGAAATDFGQVNTGAVQMAAPAAESYAFKDAAEKLGRLFGKDINRKDENTMNYLNLENKLTAPRPGQEPEKNELPDELKEVIRLADKANLAAIFTNNLEYHTNPDFMNMLHARKEELKTKTNGTVGQPA